MSHLGLFGTLLSMGATLFLRQTFSQLYRKSFCFAACVYSWVFKCTAAVIPKIEMKTKVSQRIYVRLQYFYQQHESFSIAILLSLSEAELGPWRWLCSEQKIFSGPQNHLSLIKMINGLKATQVCISFLLHRVQLTENKVLPEQSRADPRPGNCCFHDTIMSQCDDDCVTVPHL